MSPFTWNRKKFTIVKVGNPVLENVKNSFLQIPKKCHLKFYFFFAENPLTYDLLESKKKSPEMQFWIGQNVFQKFWQPCQITYFPFSRLILHIDWCYISPWDKAQQSREVRLKTLSLSAIYSTFILTLMSVCCFYRVERSFGEDEI